MTLKKRTMRLNPETITPTPTTTTTVTNTQLQAMIDQGIPAALVARDANINGVDSHVSRTCTEGVIELTQWFEKMENVFRISICSVENQIKFSTCTLLVDLKKKITDKYCSRNEMKTLEAELWNLKVKGIDVIGYNQRFQELALLCVRMFLEDSDKIERYVGGLPDMIHGNIVESRPKTMQEAVEMAIELGHFKRECPKLKNNNNHGNQVGGGNAPAKVYVEGRMGTNLDSNVVTGTFLLNNCYASILFDTGADRSFVSTAFSSQIDITPTALDHYYDVELANGRIIGLNTILRGCTSNF
ncbi:reverse transcriptase domain-containing protein [Tanacetum coccineum]|uniref:Reverse transcriptase domain-containing protein n=1 Tax=Tanacetum coccineum TaxID=301880 RepID=A0ABQ5EPY9_9ASTR